MPEWTYLQKKSINEMTDLVTGEREQVECDCGKVTIIHVDARGRKWWLCGDCLATIVGDIHDTIPKHMAQERW